MDPARWVNGVSGCSTAIRTSRPEEAEAAVAEERAGHEPGFGEDLEAVADPEDQAARRPRTHATDRMTGLNRAMTPARR